MAAPQVGSDASSRASPVLWRRYEQEERPVFNILGLIITGLIIGALARLLKPGRQRLSILATMLLGIVGALIGGVVASAIGTGGIFELNIIGFVVAVIAAVLLVGVAEGAAGKNRSKV